MQWRIALAGNPNSGKTTLFNGLTGANQFVGNWPGVTVEKKEGKLKKRPEITVTDLPGIYSLSPYTLEEVVARDYLTNERPDAILNIVDGTNLERNLYLTTQLTELGVPMAVAVNMMDAVRKNGDEIDTAALSRRLGCLVVEISALKGEGIMEAAQAAIQAAEKGKAARPCAFSQPVERVLTHIVEKVSNLPADQRRWYAVKLFERDEKAMERLQLPAGVSVAIEEKIKAVEEELDDDAESIITGQRYACIADVMQDAMKRKRPAGRLSVSDKIDRVVTNRLAALPIFAVIMFLVYFVSVTTVGTWATDWANDGVFGEGWRLLGVGSGAYNEAAEAYDGASEIVNAFIADAAEKGRDTEDLETALDAEGEAFSQTAAAAALRAFAAGYDADYAVSYSVEDEETLAATYETATGANLLEAADLLAAYGCTRPDPADYGVWIPGVPVLLGNGLEAAGCADWLSGLILDGIVAGVGAVLGFVPQILVLFLFLAFLEACGYMARIAFILDRVFRKFGLSGKSFIPILIGTGCGIPGVMASRTIENERDRRMTVMTTTFIPCGAKLPFIAMVAGAVFGGNPWIAPSAYFLGVAAIILSGIILKKTRLFKGDPAPFVMELPAYHLPTAGALLRSMWERGWSFIQKAGTIILLSTVLIWFLTYFGFVDGGFTMLADDQLDQSILASAGNAVCWLFAPLGWGNWQATVAAVTGLIAKENIVGTLGILYSAGEGTVYQTMAASFTPLSGYSFLAFNLLCAPCFAAMGAIKREMNSRKWFFIAIGYQCGLAYLTSLAVYQLGMLFTGRFGIGTAAAILVLLGFLFLLFRPGRDPVQRTKKALAAAKA